MLESWRGVAEEEEAQAEKHNGQQMRIYLLRYMDHKLQNTVHRPFPMYQPVVGYILPVTDNWSALLLRRPCSRICKTK